MGGIIPSFEVPVPGTNAKLNTTRDFGDLHSENTPFLLLGEYLLSQVIEKDSPHPQVEVAFGFTKTNPFPCNPS
jgi:hypothetical protein